MADNSADDENLEPIDEDTVKQFIANQEHELRIRERELELDRETAKQTIEAQKEDRNRHWNYVETRHRRLDFIVPCVIVAVLLFFGVLIWNGHSQIAMQLFRAALYGGGGYWAGQAHGKLKAQNDQTTDTQ
jgi:hypothetical protein